MDISKIKSRLTQLQSTTSTKDNFWKPQPGKTQIRIVPYKFNKENPLLKLFSIISWVETKLIFHQ